MQILQPNSFKLAMFMGFIDFNHFIPLSATLTLAGGHKVMSGMK